MLLNYVKLAFRLLLRNPFFSFINILGLSLGFAAFLVLWQYSSNELVSDQFHSEFKNKFRLVFDWKFKDDQGIFTEHKHALFGPHFPKILASEYDEFGKYSRLYHQAQFSLKSIGDHGKDIFLSRLNATHQLLAFKEENLAYADPNFFEFFSISLLEGRSDQVLKEPSSIVLSETMARKYFGDENALHNLLILNDSIGLKVTGIFKDLPNNTHLRFDALISSERISRQLNGLVEGAMLYFQVKSNSNRADLNARVDASAKKFLAPNLMRLNINPNDVRLYFQPLDEIAFSNLTGDVHQQRSRTILIALQVVAIVILITAWINYLNLVIYANSKRMKELGVRKTSGARSSDFVLQFIVESLIINALSILAAITLVQASKAPLEHLFQVHLSSGAGISTTVLLVITLISLSGIIITGLYPALKVINKSAKNIFGDDHRHNFYLGKSLTIFQFSVAIILTISVFAIHNQLQYVLNKDLGMKRDEVIVLDLLRFPVGDLVDAPRVDVRRGLAVAGARIVPVDHVQPAVRSEVVVEAQVDRVVRHHEVADVLPDEPRSFAIERLGVHAVMVDRADDELAAVLGRKDVVEHEPRPAVGVAALAALDAVVLVVGDRLDVVERVLVLVLAALAVIAAALDDVPEVRDDARLDEHFAVLVECDAPRVRRTVGENFEDVLRRMVAPDAGVDRDAIFVRRPGLANA